MGRTLEFKISLRFWSKTASFKALARSLGAEVNNCYDIGDMMVLQSKRAAPREASEYYMSLVDTETSDPSAVNAISRKMIEFVESNEILNRLRKNNVVEITLWIAIMGDREFDSSEIKFDEKLRHRGAGVFIENYTSFDDEGVARKLFL